MCPSGRTITAASPDLRPAFEVIDADHDGKISSEDLRLFYAGIPRSSSSNVGDSDDVIGSMISAADANKDGFVEYDEFEKVLQGYNGNLASTYGVSNGVDGLMEDVFKVMDTDGDGRLSYGDLKSYMDSAGLSATDDDIKAMIKLAGGDENDGVSLDGLLRILG